MATYKLLRELRTGQNNGHIRVRVTREWEGKKPGTSYVTSKNYILVDEEGTQIQATPIQISLIPFFTEKLKLGKVHIISDYNVVDAARTYRAVPGEYLLKLHRTTKVTKIDDIPQIPRYKFQLATFEEASKKIGEITNLMDIVGKLTNTTEIQTSKKGKKSMDILLENERDDSIKITLWENQAYAFLQFAHEYEKPNVFVIVTGTSAKDIQDETVLWSSFSTQYYFNIDHPDLVALRGNCNLHEAVIPAIVPFINRQKQTMTDPIESKKIDQLFSAELPPGASTIRYTVEATVVGVDPIKGWYYIGCQKCNTKFRNSQICSKCHETTTPIPLFRVTVEVKDSTSNTTFVLFERHILRLINVSAQHILTNDQNVDPNIIPAVLNNILRKRCMFKLILNIKNTRDKFEDYTVTEVEEMTDEASISATIGIVNPTKISHQDNADLRDHMENKRNLRAEGKNSEVNLEISADTCELLPEVGPTSSANTYIQNIAAPPPQVSDVNRKEDNDQITKRRKK